MDHDACIHIIDDDPEVVQLIRAALQEHCVRINVYASSEEFFAADTSGQIGCLIANIRLCGANGIPLMQHLCECGSNLVVIAVSEAADVSTAVRMMRYGAINFLQKPFTPDEVHDAVREALLRSRKLTARQHHVDHVRQRLSQLNEDEEQVLQCLIQGLPNKVISSKLNLSARTVDRRRQSVLHKMEATTVQELVAMLVSTEHVSYDQ